MVATKASDDGDTVVGSNQRTASAAPTPEEVREVCRELKLSAAAQGFELLAFIFSMAEQEAGQLIAAKHAQKTGRTGQLAMRIEAVVAA